MSRDTCRRAACFFPGSHPPNLLCAQRGRGLGSVICAPRSQCTGPTTPTLAADFMLFHISTHTEEFLNYIQSEQLPCFTILSQSQHIHSEILTVQRNIFSHLAKTVCLFATLLKTSQHEISTNELITKPLIASLGTVPGTRCVQDIDVVSRHFVFAAVNRILILFVRGYC